MFNASERMNIHYFVILSLGLNTEVSFLWLLSFKKIIKPIFKEELKHILPMVSVVPLKSCESANRVQIDQQCTTHNAQSITLYCFFPLY